MRSLRFRAYGERRFVALGEVTREHAERQLRGVLADVERGIWRPHEPVAAPEAELAFHELAEQWFVEREREWKPNTVADDRYKAHELAERDGLSGESINKTLTILAAVLEVAVERELIARNPAAGKRRRVKPQHRDAPTSIQPRRSRRYWTPAARSTPRRRRLVSTFVGTRCSRR